MDKQYWDQIPKNEDGKRERLMLIKRYQDELRDAAKECLRAFDGSKDKQGVALVAQAIDRVIAEYCTGKNSKIGKQAPPDCKVIRLTEDDDMTTPEGLEKALKAVRVKNCLLWVSLPCTGGSSWQRINAVRPDASAGHRKRIRKHMKLYHKLWRNLETVAHEAAEWGGKICIEWPNGNLLWNQPEVKRLVKQYGLFPVTFDGCAVDLTSSAGNPIMKPGSS